MAETFRIIEAYKNYFADFLSQQTQAVKDKNYWTIDLIEKIPRVSDTYLNRLVGTNGLYEMRIQFGGNIYRIFCFF